MRFLVAPDSFKGTFDAGAVAAAIAGGIADGGGEADRCPLADGGEGTLAVLLAARGGELRKVEAHDPLRRPVEAGFALLGDGEVAVVEAAQASGLTLVEPGERDPERADTYGTGELIAAAIGSGARTILVAAGGSATTDGGRGALEALAEAELPGLAAVGVLCDVQVSYEEAAPVFAPQKGADAAAVERLSARLDRFAAELPRDPRGVPMTGCAGGLSGALWAHGARLRSGAELILETIGFERRLEKADAVVSGEGRFDAPSLKGKVVGEVARRCSAAKKPLHLIVGGADPAVDPPAAISSITRAESLEEMRRVAFELAARASRSS